jgi:hypothetical protein
LKYLGIDTIAGGAVPSNNVQMMDAALENGVKVKSVDVENTILVLEGGETIAADLIITAYSVQSVIQRSIIDSTQFFPYQATGHNCFRFIVPKSTL